MVYSYLYDIIYNTKHEREREKKRGHKITLVTTVGCALQIINEIPWN